MGELDGACLGPLGFLLLCGGTHFVNLRHLLG